MREEADNGPQMDVDQFLDDIKTLVHDGQTLLKARMGRAREQASARLETAGRAMRENPYQSIGIAFGVGVLTGLLLHGLLHRGADDD